MRKTNVLIFLLLIYATSFLSCNRLEPVFFKIDYEPIPVVNCIFKPDSTFKVWVGLGIDYFSNDPNIIPNATVFIVDQTGDTLRLHQKDQHIFESDRIAKRGYIYKLFVETDDYGTISAQSYIPLEHPVFDSTMKLASQGYSIRFTDVYNKENYYELFNQKYIINNDSDTVLLGDGYNSCYLRSNSTIWTKENLQFYYWQDYASLIFTDKGYENQIINIELEDTCLFDGLCLRNMSEEMFLYQKSIRLFFHQSGSSFADNILNSSFNTKYSNIYTNIQNGYGIFAGYNDDAFLYLSLQN